jgi:hypothetical protein
LVDWTACTWPTWPSNGARRVSASTWRCTSATGLLAVGQQALVAGIQVGALALQARIGGGVGQGDVGLLQRVLGLGQVDLRHRTAVVAALVALQVAVGGLPFDGGLVGFLARLGAGQGGVQRGTAGLGFQAGQGGLFLGQLAAQFRAVDDRQFLALLDHVTGDHLQVHGAGRDGVQDRAVGGDHPAVGGDVADQVTRFTSAMRTRLLSKERLALDQACTAQPMPASSDAFAPSAGQR